MLPFDLEDAVSLNKARMAHLGSLGLDFKSKRVLEVGAGVGYLTGFFEANKCDIVITEGREENVKRIIERYPHRADNTFVRDLTVPGSHEEFGEFDVIFCYGTLYHVSDPAFVIAELAKLCTGMFLVSMVVHPSDDNAFLPCPEDGGADQSMHAMGCRPGRQLVMDELKKHFEYVYHTTTQPFHHNFIISWPAVSGHTRSIFVASREKLDSRFLSEELQMDQQRYGRILGGEFCGSPAEAVLVGPGSVGHGGSWSQANGEILAWDIALVTHFYKEMKKLDDPIILDIGASTGSFSLLPAIDTTAACHSFEPYPFVNKILRENVRMNGLDDRVTIYDWALSDRNGSAVFVAPPKNKQIGHARLDSNHQPGEWPEIEVQCRTLDSLNLGKVDLVKIDVEGHELQVLRGGEATIRENMPGLIVELYPDHAHLFDYEVEDVTDLLASWGYNHFERVTSWDTWAKKI